MYIGKFGKGKNVYVRLMECYRDKETGKNKIRVLKNFGRYEDLIKDEGLDWKRDNQSETDYLGYKEHITVQDAYKAYDKLKGRKDHFN